MDVDGAVNEFPRDWGLVWRRGGLLELRCTDHCADAPQDLTLACECVLKQGLSMPWITGAVQKTDVFVAGIFDPKEAVSTLRLEGPDDLRASAVYNFYYEVLGMGDGSDASIHSARATELVARLRRGEASDGSVRHSV
jgi:hypothetical protein